RFGTLTCCILLSVLLSGCLTRRNALPSNRTVSSAPYRKPAKNAGIPTDASTSPRNARASGGTALLEGYAEVLGVRPGELENRALYQYIDKWIGTPHRLGGTSHRGIDCSAFVGMVMHEVYGKSI